MALVPYVPAHSNDVGFSVLRPPSTQTTIQYGTIGGPRTTVTNDNTVVSSSFKSPSSNGIFHPKFKGFRGTTGYSRVVCRTQSLGGYDLHQKGFNNTVANRWFSSSSVSSNALIGHCLSCSESGSVSVSLNLRNRAVAEALVKVQNQKVNLGVALAEARRTSNMVATRVVSLVKFVRALKRGRFGDAYKALFGDRKGYRADPRRDASSAWLEWLFGWMPLVNDVWGGIEQVQDGFRQKNLVFNVTRTCTQPLDPRGFFQPTLPQSLIMTSGSASESVRVKLWGAVTNTVHSANALGLLNPAVIAWELVPYSFLIDWLVPVGTWLESLTAAVGVEFVGGCMTELVQADVQGTRFQVGFIQNPSQYHGTPAKARRQVCAMKRTPYTSWPWALLYWKSPFSNKHLITALALLSNRR